MEPCLNVDRYKTRKTEVQNAIYYSKTKHHAQSCQVL